jgi:hypothetical protein
VIKADAADQMAEATGWSSSSSQTYQTKATLTWTPGSSGDYLIIAAAEISSDANGDATYFQLNYVTGASVYGDRIWYCGRVGQSPVRRDGEADARRQRAQTFRAEYKTGTASVLAWVGDARILALRLDKFDNSYFASNYNVQATTSAGYQEFLTLTQTPQAVDHAIIAIGAYNPVSTTVSGYAQALQGATSLSEVVKESQNTAGYQYLGMVSKQTLAATSTHGSGKPGPRPRAPQSTPTSSPSPFYSLAPHPRQALAAATWRSRAEPSSWGSIVSPEQQSATIIALHDAVNKIEATLNDGMKAMIAEHRVELKQIKGEVETIRTTVTSHVANEDVLFQIFQKTLGLGIAIGGTLLATLLAMIGSLLTHQNPWLNP